MLITPETEAGDIMGQVLHRNSKGIVMVREDFKARSQVKVLCEFAQKHPCIRTYRFNLIQEPVEVPYCSWANLDCCGGWSFDEEYLDTAVQRGRKLFAGRTTSLRSQYTPNYPTLEEAREQFSAFQDTLPDDMTADVDSIGTGPNFFHTYICRTGKITDYIDLNMVFDFYEKLGQHISDAEKAEVERLCDCPIKLYGSGQAPFSYADADTNTEFITTGLLLGYPIESTVSILQGH